MLSMELIDVCCPSLGFASSALQTADVDDMTAVCGGGGVRVRVTEKCGLSLPFAIRRLMLYRCVYIRVFYDLYVTEMKRGANLNKQNKRSRHPSKARIRRLCSNVLGMPDLRLHCPNRCKYSRFSRIFPVKQNVHD